MIERRRSAQIAGRGIHRNGSELKCIPDRVVGEEGEDIGREVEHHQVSGIFLTDEAAGEESESGLHKEDEVAGVEGPGKIGGDADVAHVVG